MAEKFDVDRLIGGFAQRVRTMTQEGRRAGETKTVEHSPARCDATRYGFGRCELPAGHAGPHDNGRYHFTVEGERR